MPTLIIKPYNTINALYLSSAKVSPDNSSFSLLSLLDMNQESSQKARPFLTVAIPTYNRASLLRSSLQELIPLVSGHNQNSEQKIEVLVVDNCSKDNTQDVVNAFQRACGILQYHKNERNLGIDGNICRCMMLSKGKYVHLLSDDDRVVEAIYSELIPYIFSYRPDFVHLNVLFGDSECKAVNPNAPVIQVDGTGFVPLPINDFAQATHIWMTFISCFVANREKWLDIQDHESFLGSEIYLSHVAFRLIANSGTASISQHPYIIARSNYTGSFRIVKAFAVEWLSLVRYLPALGYSRRVVSALEKITVREYLPGFVLISRKRAHCQQGERFLLLKSLSRYPFAWLMVYPIALAPSNLLSILIKLRRSLKSCFAP